MALTNFYQNCIILLFSNNFLDDLLKFMNFLNLYSSYSVTFYAYINLKVSYLQEYSSRWREYLMFDNLYATVWNVRSVRFLYQFSLSVFSTVLSDDTISIAQTGLVSSYFMNYKTYYDNFGIRHQLLYLIWFGLRRISFQNLHISKKESMIC